MSEPSTPLARLIAVSKLVFAFLEPDPRADELQHELSEAIIEAEALRASASPPPTSPRTGCINCGEANDGGYLTGREGHIDEGAVGPFCSLCWQLLVEDFSVRASTPPSDPSTA